MECYCTESLLWMLFACVVYLYKLEHLLDYSIFLILRTIFLFHRWSDGLSSIFKTLVCFLFQDCYNPPIFHCQKTPPTNCKITQTINPQNSQPFQPALEVAVSHHDQEYASSEMSSVITEFDILWRSVMLKSQNVGFGGWWGFPPTPAPLVNRRYYRPSFKK